MENFLVFVLFGVCEFFHRIIIYTITTLRYIHLYITTIILSTGRVHSNLASLNTYRFSEYASCYETIKRNWLLSIPSMLACVYGNMCESTASLYRISYFNYYTTKSKIGTLLNTFRSLPTTTNWTPLAFIWNHNIHVIVVSLRVGQRSR